MTLIDWFRNPNKYFKNGSVGWKAMVLAFPLIGNWTTWKIGNGKSVRIGEYPWAGAKENYKLPNSVIIKLREQRCSKLADVQSEHPYPLGRTNWKSARELGMEGDVAESWNSYVHLWEINFVNLDEEEQDKLIWTRNSINGD